MRGFIEFIREQGVVGLAVGFVLGGAVSKVVTSIVNDLINPLIGIALGAAGGLSNATFKLGPATIFYGRFLSTMIDFVIIALVVYISLRILQLDKIDRKKEK